MPLTTIDEKQSELETIYEAISKEFKETPVGKAHEDAINKIEALAQDVKKELRDYDTTIAEDETKFKHQNLKRLFHEELQDLKRKVSPIFYGIENFSVWFYQNKPEFCQIFLLQQ